ncbi:MAG: HAMP domain-containing histidine kinase, partial [Lentisphaeraceae bacterium]|nr:HAMP domain-containing histidine kinase [Lentisphaeraceae bacterium]
AQSVDSYLVLSLGGFLVMTLPVFFMSYMSLEKTHSLMRKDVLELINLTNFVKQPHIDEFKKKGCRLDEMSVLYKSIEDLVSILKNRHMLSEDDFARTKQSNQELEQVVKRSQDDVSMTNDLLSRKNMELEQILYAASHDLRTPLIGVQGFSQELQYLCEMLMDELKEMGVSVNSSEKLSEILQNDIPNSVRFIIQGSNKMDSMIQGLLRVSRVGLEKISTEAVDMDEMLKQIVDCLSFQAQSANAMILVDVLEPCVCDKEKLEQVFTNLIANAIKYRHEDRSCEIRVSCETHEKEIHYLVSDNGIGINENNLENVFKTFFRVDAGNSDGEGLGLTIANRIVEKHGGRLTVEAQKEGCLFKVIIPVKTSES